MWCKTLRYRHPSPQAQCAGGSSPGCSPVTQKTNIKKHLSGSGFKYSDLSLKHHMLGYLLFQRGNRQYSGTHVAKSDIWKENIYWASSPPLWLTPVSIFLVSLYYIKAARLVCKRYKGTTWLAVNLTLTKSINSCCCQYISCWILKGKDLRRM